MNFRQLVLRNATRNGRTYASYFFSSLFSVMVFFIFSLLFFHPDIKNGVMASSDTAAFLATTGVTIAQVVIVIMSFIFLWYTFSIFIKARKRDFSIYMILGMSEKDMKRMIFFENILLGITSIVTGIIMGLIFSKLVLLISQNVLALEEGLAFYLPIKPILLTVVVYLILFLIISLITALKLQTENLTEMSKATDKPLVEPKTNLGLALLSLLLIGSGYASVLLFAFRFNTDFRVGVSALVSGVLLTILGTYLFFQQNSVRLFAFLKKQTLFLKGANMLTFSNLIFRMKTNATMYFMIAIVASVAFVGIGTTMSIGGQDFAMTQEQSFAYTYTGGGTTDNQTSDNQTSEYHQKNIRFIEETIKKEGYRPLTVKIIPLDLTYWDEENNENWLSLVKESDYNRLATFNNQTEIHLESDRSLLLLAASNSEMATIRNDKLMATPFTMEAELAAGLPRETLTYQYSLARFNFNYGQVALISDQFYQELMQMKINAATSEEPVVFNQSFIIDYPEWAENATLNNKIKKVLELKMSDYEKEVDAVFEKIGSKENYTEAEQTEIEEVTENWFYYTSLYDTWLQTKQANGMVLLISVLLGAVFFTFAACIIYFRLFGELPQDGAYQHSLHILGVSRPVRHKIATREMLVMYFVPIVIAVCHFAVAMFALGRLIDLPVWLYFARIVSAYVIFQLLFFIVSRWRYLKHLDVLAEKN